MHFIEEDLLPRFERKICKRSKLGKFSGVGGGESKVGGEIRRELVFGKEQLRRPSIVL